MVAGSLNRKDLNVASWEEEILKKIFLTLGVFLFSCSAVAENRTSLWSGETCPGHEGLVANLNAVKKSARMDSIWPGYSPVPKMVVLIDVDDRARCATVYESTGVRSIVLPKPIRIDNGVYEFLDRKRLEDTTLPVSKNEGLKRLFSLLSSEVYANIMVFNANSVALKRILLESGLKTTLNQLNTEMLIHEGFHYFGQWLNMSHLPWPNWPEKMPGAYRSPCYSATPEVVRLFDEELRSLMQGFQLSIQRAELSAIIEQLLLFSKARNQRYQILKDLKILDEGQECSLTEGKWEMIEGLTDFVAIASTADANVTNSIEITDYMKWSSRYNPPFYQLGALQLLILRAMNEEKFRSGLLALSESKEPEDGIFALTQSMIGRGR